MVCSVDAEKRARIRREFSARLLKSEKTPKFNNFQCERLIPKRYDYKRTMRRGRARDVVDSFSGILKRVAETEGGMKGD